MTPEQFLESGIDVFLHSIFGDDDEDIPPGMRETSQRVAHAYTNELLRGMFEDPRKHLEVQFVCDFDEMVMVGNIPVYSLCEHHMLPFIGKAWVAYIPRDGRITGLSKLVRVVDGYARRFQVQERLTKEIAQAIEDVLEPHGVGVYIEAEHLCMTARGVQAPGTRTKTSVMLGAFRDNIDTRAEFFSLVNT